MKVKEWQEARPRLMQEYKDRGIVECEGQVINEDCQVDYILSLHHIDRRSSGKAENTFEKTRLLCQNCHFKADHSFDFKPFNNLLRKIR